MGKPMCLNLQKAGAELIVTNRSQAIVKELNQESNITGVSSVDEVATHCDIIILMLSDTTAVENVLFGDSSLEKKGLIHSIKTDSLIIDMGTTAVTPTRDFATRLKEHGVDYVDAPVSGGELGAINASLVIMAGGNETAIARATPIFDVLGASFVHIGDVGAGQIAKAANQMIVGLTIGAVSEAMTLAQKAGADLSKVREALMGGFASSRILELHGQRMIDETFQPGGKITTQHKDLTQVLDLAAEYDQDLPATSLNRRLFQNLIENGNGDLDHSALILAYKKSELLKHN
ncbi:UNVERIFIED_CONTAM: hypothetical protein GTU68_043114 [Idotea baltica]|nr:hypothetical protein [Idotea baltica]